MGQVLRSFLPGYPDKFGFRFTDEIFLHGLKFSLKEKYPWRNRLEMKGFFEKLYTHKSVDSYRKIIEWKTALHQEQTHVYYSWALILRFLSLAMIIACLVLFILNYPLYAEIMLGTGIILLISEIRLRRLALHSSQSWVKITGLLRTLIDQAGKHIEAA
jgi:hypothetical protein